MVLFGIFDVTTSCPSYRSIRPQNLVLVAVITYSPTEIKDRFYIRRIILASKRKTSGFPKFEIPGILNLDVRINLDLVPRDHF